jgi:hypothetical protein
MAFRIAERRWTTDDRVEIISQHDPSLINEITTDEDGDEITIPVGWKQYDNGYDEEHLRFKEGQTPCIFVVHPLSPVRYESTRIKAIGAAEQFEQMSINVMFNVWKRLAFLGGVVKVRNIEVQVDGKWRKRDLSAQDAARDLPPVVINGIGDAILEMSRPPERDEEEGQDVEKSSPPGILTLSGT